MHKNVKSAVRVASCGIILLMLGAAGLVAHSSGAPQKGKPAPPPPPPPLVATFADAQGDNVLSDGATYNGYVVTNNVVEGAYSNSAGNITINLAPGGLDRHMVFRFDTEVGSAGVTACALPANTDIPADVVDFRFAPGAMSMGVGETAYDIPAVINFTPRSSTGTQPVANVFLGFGNVLFPNTLAVTRTSATEWTLASTATVELRCSTTNGRKGTTVSVVGNYYMPFTLHVVM